MVLRRCRHLLGDEDLALDAMQEVFVNLINDIVPDFAKSSQLGLVRFCAAKMFYFEERKNLKYIQKNPKAWGIYIVRVAYHELEDDYYTHSDSFALMRLYKAGRYALLYGRAGISVDVHVNEGGCQARDREKDGRMSLKAIKRDFPKCRWVESNNALGFDIDTSMYFPQPERFTT